MVVNFLLNVLRINSRCMYYVSIFDPAATHNEVFLFVIAMQLSVQIRLNSSKHATLFMCTGEIGVYMYTEALIVPEHMLKGDNAL